VQITEVKRHLDGRVERFACTLVLRRPHLVVVCFDHKRRRRAGGFVLPAGGRSHGFFWRRRPYVLYRILGPRGRLIAHRFDAVADVRLRDDEVSYLDLLLDVWVDPSGAARVEDDDHVADYAARGLLSRARARRIASTRALLVRRHRAIAGEAARLLEQAGV
jgi:hypothetical protein